MSRTINESVQLLTETLGNCKTALTEKEVTDVDNIKISDVDEKIEEISAGGGESNRFECTFNSIKFYTNIEDSEPYRTLNISEVNKTVYTRAHFSNFYADSLRFKKMVFDLSVKNVGNNYTEKDVHVVFHESFMKQNLKCFIKSTDTMTSPKVEVTGTIVNGSGNIQISIQNDDNNMFIGSNVDYPIVVLIFGKMGTTSGGIPDDLNFIHIYAYNYYT